MSQISEITYYQKQIEELINDIDILKKRITWNESKIDEYRNKIIDLEKRANNDTFKYDPLLDGKINDMSIDKIIIYGYDCTKCKDKCDGLHNIHIFGNNLKERLNFNNTRKFSVEELKELNYIDKLTVNIDDDDDYQFKKKCNLAKLYPNKIIRMYTYGDCN